MRCMACSNDQSRAYHREVAAGERIVTHRKPPKIDKICPSCHMASRRPASVTTAMSRRRKLAVLVLLAAAGWAILAAVFLFMIGVL